MSNPFQRPGESAQRTGTRFEVFWAKLLGVEPQKGSGNQWTAKMDVADSVILWSLKHTDNATFPFHPKLLQEAEAAINGPGGIGGDAIPGVAISVGGEAFVAFRAEDFLRMATTDIKYIEPSKGEQKRRRAKVPALLRREEEE